jgi:hypothetical protein
MMVFTRNSPIRTLLRQFRSYGLVFCLLASAMGISAPVAAQEPAEVGTYFAQAEGGASALSDASEQSFLAGALGYGFRMGWRSAPWGAFVQIGQDMWLTSEVNSQLVDGVMNIGLGGEYFYFSQRLRASLAAGTSTLLFDTILDESGTTGLFVDLRPAGLRWTITDWMTIELDPLTFSVSAPVLFGLPMVRVEYRTVLVGEFRL